ncbi:secreted immunoglobulin domain 1 [Pungitius pungitius]|uniref:secreted immunoglobulin domain 1 n=1 Tax=Pungitius pungitius TaxID=134920 RepID=UPI002E165534
MAAIVSTSNNNNNSSFISQWMMESLPVFLILLSISSFRWEPHPAAASPASPVRVRVGQDAALWCPLLDAASTNASSTLSWYRTAAGRRPELLLSFRSTNASDVKYGAAVGPGKASAKADGSLLLLNATRSDSAVYYCAVTWGGE